MVDLSSHKINHLSELSSNRFQEQFATSPTPAGTSADLLPIAPDKIFTWCNVKQKHYIQKTNKPPQN